MRIKTAAVFFIWSQFLLMSCADYDTLDIEEGTARKHFQSSVSNTPPTTQFLGEQDGGMLIQINLGGVNIGAFPTHGQVFSTLDVVTAGWTNEIGRPRLPVIRKFVEIPKGSSAKVGLQDQRSGVLGLASINIEGEVAPVQEPLVKLPNATQPFRKDIDTYNADQLYPEPNVVLSGPFVIRGRNLMLVEYYPIQYNPQRRQIRVASSSKIRIELTGGSEVYGQPAVEASDSASFNRWFETNVINYPSQQPSTWATSYQKYAEGILFVVGNAYADNSDLADYIEARRTEGHKVEMVSMSSVGSTADELRAYVRDQYLEWSEPSLGYLVLVGDTDNVPTYNGSGGGKSQVTDLYYASIDPDNYQEDLLAPDLIVSRISVNNTTELQTYIDRANKYIYADFNEDTTWMKKLSFIASCDKYSVTEGTHNHVIDTYTTERGFTGTFPDNPQAGGDKLYCNKSDLTESVIQEHLGDGRLAINFSGHGSNTYWHDPKFTESYLQNVQPDDAIPFVISNACITGTFGRSGGDCWGEIWLSHSHGAILFWGASNNSYWTEDDIMERLMWEGVFSDDITRLGNITQNAKMKTLAHFGANDTMKYYFEMYNMLGDATLDFYTDLFFPIVASYPTEITLGEDKIDFSVTGDNGAIENALVCVRNGDIQQVGYTDSAGRVQLALEPMPNNIMDLNVVITAHNAKRHQGIIKVISASGAYLTYQAHAITVDGLEPSKANPGKHIVLPVTLKNVGKDAATGITAKLYTQSDAVTITDDTAHFDDVAVNDTVLSNDHFAFDIKSYAADQTVVVFDVEWTTSSGISGTTSFSINVERPVFKATSMTVDDSESGCDQDGFADPNEPTLFQVTFENQGSGDASQIEVVLSVSECTVDQPVYVDNLASGASTMVSFTVTPLSGIACPAEEVAFTVSVNAEEIMTADSSVFYETLNADIQGGKFEDDMEGSEPNGWSHEAAIGTDDWGYVSDDFHSETHSWFSSSAAELKDDYLLTPTINIGNASVLSFWHKFDLENKYDGAVIEISSDGGATFQDLGDYITQNGYLETISTSYSNPIKGRQAWTGKIEEWQQVIIDLSSFGPAEVVLRFRQACDTSVSKTGWWIDDVEVDSEIIICHQPSC